jgi:hypothetical protein
MNRKHVAIMLTCAAVVYACAPRNRTAIAAETQQQPASIARTTDSSGLALTVSESDEPHAMSFELELINTGKLMELRFPNGRTHDFVVVDEQNREVWRWSAERLFTQSLQTKQLKKGDAVRYHAQWNEAIPGRYRVIASLTSDSHSQPIEREFIVR